MAKQVPHTIGRAGTVLEHSEQPMSWNCTTGDWKDSLQSRMSRMLDAVLKSLFVSPQEGQTRIFSGLVALHLRQTHITFTIASS